MAAAANERARAILPFIVSGILRRFHVERQEFDQRETGGKAGRAVNLNNPSTKARFTSTDVITYDLTASGDGWRVDFTIVGTSADNEGVILTGHAIDGRPRGFGRRLDLDHCPDRDWHGPVHRDRDRVRRRRGDRALK